VPRRGAALALALAACSDGSAATGVAPADTGATTTGGIAPATSSTTAADTSTTDAPAPTTGDDPTTEGPPTFCADLDVSLVLHPGLKIYGPQHRAAFAGFFADLVEGTGARVRVLPNVGTEVMLKTDCLLPLGNAPDDPVLVYGEGGVVDPAAADALDCTLDAIVAYESDFDVGNYLFSGMMFPILEVEGWPAEGATALAILAAYSDDAQNNMYTQPGIVAESYLRLAGGSDRRRVAALTFGDGAGKLEIFGLALSDKSRHYERSQTTLIDALADWAPLARRACEDFDDTPPIAPEPPPGCERIDVLFTIDGSGSMAGEQDALRGADGMPPVFAEFTDALLAELTDVEDFHVGVVSSQEGSTALHTHTDAPVVPESPETDCGLPPGQRWLVGPSPTLAQDFACIAATADDTYEVTAYNTAEALHDPVNAGFLRDDSLVFVVMMTDEDTDDAHLARMVEIRQRMLDAVGGDLSRLVVLGIAGGQGTFEAPQTTCSGVYGKAAPGRRLASIVYSLRDRGRMQNICEGDLASTFADVIDDVVSACEAYDPVP
jgi:hypothetical protein